MRKVFSDAGIYEIVTDASEKFLFVCKSAGETLVIDVASGKELFSWRLKDLLEGLAVSPDDQWFVVGDNSGEIHCWKLTLNNAVSVVSTQTPITISVHKGDVYGIAFTANGESVITAGRDGSVRRTSLAGPKESYRELLGMRKVQCFPISGTNGAVAFANTPLDIRNPETGEVVKKFSSVHYLAAAISADGTHIAAASNKSIDVRNMATGKTVLTLKQERKWVKSLEFSPDGSFLIEDSHDGVEERIDVINLRARKVNRYSAHGHASRWAYFCDDDSVVAWLSTPGKLICWKIQDMTVRWETNPLELRCTISAISPDHAHLLVLDRRVLKLINCLTGKVCYRVPCDYQVTSLGFSSDGRVFLVGGEQGQLSLWHAGTGQPLFEVANIGTPVESIQPLDDGFLVSTRRVKDGRTEHVWLEF